MEYCEVNDAIKTLKEDLINVQPNEKIDFYRYISCWDLENEYSHNEISDMCYDFCNVANKYLEDNGYSHLYATTDSEDAYVIYVKNELDEYDRRYYY